MAAVLLALVAGLLTGVGGTAAAAPAPSAATSARSVYPLRVGSTGQAVRNLTIRLRWAGAYGRPAGLYYSGHTAAAVRVFQERMALPVTGRADSRTVRVLRAATWRRGTLPRACSVPRVICIDKTLRLLRDMRRGRLVQRVAVRFGADATPTREGTHTVYVKRTLAISNLPGARGARMPYSMFFSRGEAIHYSYAFAAEGYHGASHGCVNVRSMSAARALFLRTPIGRRVYIYH